MENAKKMLSREIETYSTEKRYVRKNGSIAWINLTVALVWSAEGDPQYFISVIEDISKRKRAEEEQRESEERFQQVAETMSEVFWMSDPAITKIYYVSPAYEAIWGRSCKSLYEDPKSFLDAIHPEDRGRILGELGKQLSHGKFEFEFRIVQPDGSIRWISDRGFTIRNENGEVYRTAGIAQDITNRKHAEEEKQHLQKQLLQAQKLEAIGQLAGGVAHDYNNTLMAITGFSELLLLKQSEDEACRKIVLEIQKASDHGTELTRQLLAFSRQQVLSPRILDLNASITKTEDMLRPLISEDVRLCTVLAKDLGFVKADPGQIQQVIVNLVVNARDAMPHGGQLRIETENINLDKQYARAHAEIAPGHYVMLSVSDTGCGMDDATTSRIFEPFFTTKEEGKGTGLGLSTVYGIVKQSGGYISVCSQPGSGTTFKVYLPRVDDANPKESPPPSDPHFSGRGELLLLVDDNEAIRNSMGTLLELKGYKVLKAESGVRALEIVNRQRGAIHLLITDVVMPEMGGKELAQRLSTQHPGMKVLYMSGYSPEAIRGDCFLTDGTGFLSKPAKTQSLLLKIRDLLSGQNGNYY